MPRADTPSRPPPSRLGSEEVRVRDVWNGFSTYMRDDKGYSASTRRQYLTRCQAAHRWLRSNGEQGLPWATTKSLRMFWDSVSPSPTNRNEARSSLAAFFAFVKAAGWRPDDPTSGLPRVRVPRRLPRPIAAPEVKRLLDVADAAGPMVACLVNVLAYCGLRRAELLSLRWSDIDGPWIRVIGKGDKERAVPIPPPAMLAVVRWRKSTTSAEWVFPSARSDDRPMSRSALQYLIADIADTACVQVTPHILRHTYATLLLGATGDITVVQQALGHSKPETSAVYAKVNPAKLGEAAIGLQY